MRKAPTTRRDAGFSMLEILVVVAIIGVLVGLGFTFLVPAMQTNDVEMTRTRIARLVSGIEAVHATYGQYPPTQLEQIRRRLGANAPVVGQAPNDRNEGSESAWRVMAHTNPALAGAVQLDSLGNTDRDAIDGRPLSEMRDAWGHPLVYVEARDYHSAARYTNGAGRVDLVRAWRTERGQYAMPRSFQVFSVGPNGAPGTADDIKHWSRDA